MDQTTTQEPPRKPESMLVVVSPSQGEEIQENTLASLDLAAELQKPEIIAEFQKLQSLVENPLFSGGKERILEAAQEHGFTLPELYQAFRSDGQGFKRAGGLIKFATEIFPELRQNGHAPTVIRTHSREQIASGFRSDPAYQAQAGTFDADTVSPERLRELQDEATNGLSEFTRQLARQRLRELSAS